MDDVFLGEIRYVAFNYAPKGWALCNGQILPIRQNIPLFALLGVNYGGDGVSTFALPDLQGRVAVSQGEAPGLSPYNLGQQGGSETETLTADQLAAHTHGVLADASNGTSSDPTTGVYGKAKGTRGSPNLYDTMTTGQAAANAIGSVGGGQAHENRAPGLALTAIIALQGIFPQRP